MSPTVTGPRAPGVPAPGNRPDRDLHPPARVEPSVRGKREETDAGW
ncbi:hypothetical protein J7I94_37195 [Streptomyces sp. ISL-12]|nr:hypothetical protein [Streptomyces sp. ISL-12]MBT2416096.1 hypothetical protein [Streptomyces sp. ISL-12]